MTVEDWLQAATADARRRGLEDLEPLLQSLARSLELLRKADWNADAADGASGVSGLSERERP
jgi:hypothetical protein